MGQASAQLGRPSLIGWLNFGSRASNGHLYTAFKGALDALGWKEASQYVVDERWADNRVEALAPLATELAARKPDVIVAWPTQAVGAAVKAAPGTPIVMATGGDPVKSGYAVSLAHPGGMVTGLTNVSTDVAEKYLELLLEAVPRVQSVAFLFGVSSLSSAYMESAKRSIAGKPIKTHLVQAGSTEEIGPALSRVAKEGIQALIVTVNPLFFGNREAIARTAMVHKWPMMAFASEFVEAGALLTYGPNLAESYRRAAVYVDKILKGAKPDDLPIEQPTKLELVVSLKTATALGLKIPQSLLLRADDLIQ